MSFSEEVNSVSKMLKELLLHLGLSEFQFQLDQIPSQHQTVRLSLTRTFEMRPMIDGPNVSEIFGPMIEGIRKSHLVKSELLERDQHISALEKELKSTWEKVATLLPYQTTYRMQFFAEHGKWPDIPAVLKEDDKDASSKSSK